MRVAYIVTEDWYFLSHRLPVARAARAAGYEVVVLARDSGRSDDIRAEGFRFEPLDWQRGAFGPATLIREFFAVRSALQRVQPDLLHLVAMKPILIGSLVRALGERVPAIAAFTGLGHVFTGGGIKATLAKTGLRFSLSDKAMHLLFQNRDDQADLLNAIGRRGMESHIIQGSGVDTDHFQPLAEPADGPIAIGMVARMLRSKGPEDLVAAGRILSRQGIAHRMILAGTPDPESHETLAEADMARMRSEPYVTLPGHVTDVRQVWADASIAVLPQRDREGLPKSLLEAAACGRALVATDVPGCRDIVRNGETGLLVPPNNPGALAEALATLIADPVLRKRLGANARALVVERLSAEAVARQTMALYREALA